MRIFTIIVAIILLITAFVDLGVGIAYYQLLRWMTTICAVLLAIRFYEKNQGLFITFCIIAILFNPIAPIYYDKTIWRIFDLLSGIAFAFTVMKNK